MKSKTVILTQQDIKKFIDILTNYFTEIQKDIKDLNERLTQLENKMKIQEEQQSKISIRPMFPVFKK